MKKKEHRGAWLLGTFLFEAFLVDALLKHVTFGVMARSSFMASYVPAFLAFDAGFGISLLPVINTLQRGTGPLKRAALALLLPPLLYILWRVVTHLPFLFQS